MLKSYLYKYCHLENKSIETITADLPIQLIHHFFWSVMFLHSDKVSVGYSADATTWSDVLFEDELNHISTGEIWLKGDSTQLSSILYSLHDSYLSLLAV